MITNGKRYDGVTRKTLQWLIYSESLSSNGQRGGKRMWISELLRWVSVSIGKDAIVPIYCLGKRRVLGPLLQTVCRSRRMKASSFPCEVGNHEGRIRKNGHSVPYPSLVIPARRGVFTSWNQPNGSFRSSEFKYTSILSLLLSDFFIPLCSSPAESSS